MDLTFLLRGLVIGFSIAAPVGPIGVLCIRRTLADGRAAGLVSGLGAASADACYGFIAAFGLTFISNFLIDQKIWLHLIGGAFLCYLGIRTFLAQPAAQGQPTPVEGRSLFASFSSTLFLTLTNPVTVLSFVAIFAGLGIASANGGYATAAVLVSGVFLGSASWWLLLSGGVSLFRSRIDSRALEWINRISGVVITAFGAAALASLMLRRAACIDPFPESERQQDTRLEIRAACLVLLFPFGW
ncbi:MAG TPA: LysE family transporter [Anaerolineae bacterium]